MADISKISPDGGTTEYNIKDATARSSVTTIDGKIPSSASSSNKLATASDVNDLWSANAVLGAKNLGNFVNGKGINTSGVVIDDANRIATVDPINIVNGAEYKVTWDLSVGLAIYAVWNGSTLVRREANVENGSVLNTAGGDKLYVCVYASEALTVAGTKPMVILSSDTDPTYAPYAMTNGELTEAVIKRTTGTATTSANGNFNTNLRVDECVVIGAYPTGTGADYALIPCRWDGTYWGLSARKPLTTWDVPANTQIDYIIWYAEV